MVSALILRPRLCREIRDRTDKILRELGNPDPPLRLEDVRELLRLDREYFTSEQDGLLASVASKLKRGGKQILRRPTILLDAVKKFDLRALYLPDRRRILIDDSTPTPKHRWLEAHEIGHDLLPWHHDMMLGDDELTPTASTHSKMEAEANYAAGSLLFLGDRFREECQQMLPTIENVQLLRKRYGNTMTTTLWRMIEYAGESNPMLGAIGRHPATIGGAELFRHLIPSRAFDQRFDVPASETLMRVIQTYCGARRRGPLGSGEVQLSDRWGTRHDFEFETFFNGYDALTLGIYRGESPLAVQVS